MLSARTGSVRVWIPVGIAVLAIAGGLTLGLRSRSTMPVEPAAWTAGLVGISNLHGDVLPCT